MYDNIVVFSSNWNLYASYLIPTKIEVASHKTTNTETKIYSYINLAY